MHLNDPQNRLFVGDLVGIAPTGYNHGCMDVAVARYDGGTKWTVIEATSCHSCWQVGHDESHVFWSVGDVLELTRNDVRVAVGRWARSVKWEW